MSVRRTNTRARILALLLVLFVLLAAGLTLALRDWVRDFLLTPLLFILWLGGLLIKSTPQWVFWAVFLVMALLILANSLGAGKGFDQTMGKAEPGYPRRARVSFWAIQVHQQARGHSPPTSSAEPLRRLVLEVMAFQERLSLREVEQRLEFGELDVPPVIQAYLQNRLAAEPFTPSSFWVMLKRR